MKKATNESGFSLVELLVVAVLGALLVMSTYQVVITNQRVYTAQQVQIQGQQATRTGMDVLFGELREISPASGDLVSMETESMRVRVLRGIGHMCSSNTLSPVSFTVRSMGRPFVAKDSLFIFADNNPRRTEDDVWLNGLLNSEDAATTCPDGQDGQRLTLTGMTSAFQNDEVLVGAPVRAYRHLIYELVDVDGQWYLGRRGPEKTAEPLVGPLKPEDGGVRFVYLDASGQETAVATDVRQIRVTLGTGSDARDSRGELVQDSLVATIYTRN